MTTPELFAMCRELGYSYEQTMAHVETEQRAYQYFKRRARDPDYGKPIPKIILEDVRNVTKP